MIALVFLMAQQPSQSPVNEGLMKALLYFVGLMVSGGVVGAIVNGFFGRRRLSAEAVKMIQEAAAGTIKDVREDAQEARQQIGELELRERNLKARIGELEDAVDTIDARSRRERRRWYLLAEAHAEWDAMVVKQLRRLDPAVTLPDPPTLYPHEESTHGRESAGSQARHGD